MKKLALVALLAVAASWLLSERRPGERFSVVYHSGSVLEGTDDRPPVSLPTATPVEVAELPETPFLSEPPSPPKPPERPASKRKSIQVRKRREVPKPPVTATRGPLPAWFPKTVEEETSARLDHSGVRVMVSQLSNSESLAFDDLRKSRDLQVSKWLATDIPTTWKPPAPAIEAMVQEAHVRPVTRSLKPTPSLALPGETPVATDEIQGLDDLYTFYQAGQKLDFSPERKSRFVETYRRDLATGRMQRLGGGLAVALTCLVFLTGYIRADEATRGYYTNRLRMAAVAGLAAAGVVAYRWIS